MYKFEEGDKVKCNYIGFEGFIISRTWENGPQYTIQKENSKDFFYREEHELDGA